MRPQHAPHFSHKALTFPVFQRLPTPIVPWAEQRSQQSHLCLSGAAVGTWLRAHSALICSSDRYQRNANCPCTPLVRRSGCLHRIFHSGWSPGSWNPQFCGPLPCHQGHQPCCSPSPTAPGPWEFIPHSTSPSTNLLRKVCSSHPPDPHHTPPPWLIDRAPVYTVPSHHHWEGYRPEEWSSVLSRSILDPDLIKEFHKDHPNQPDGTAGSQFQSAHSFLFLDLLILLSCNVHVTNSPVISDSHSLPICINCGFHLTCFWSAHQSLCILYQLFPLFCAKLSRVFHLAFQCWFLLFCSACLVSWFPILDFELPSFYFLDFFAFADCLPCFDPLLFAH